MIYVGMCSGNEYKSTGIQKMQKAATEKGFDAEIFAVAAAEAQDYVEKQHVDVVLLGPQVRFMERILRKNGAKRNSSRWLFQWLITE